MVEKGKRKELGWKRTRKSGVNVSVSVSVSMNAIANAIVGMEKLKATPREIKMGRWKEDNTQVGHTRGFETSFFYPLSQGLGSPGKGSGWSTW